MFERVKSYYAGKFVSKGEWKHPDKIIDTYEIIFVTKGNVYINKGGVNYALGVNDVILLEPGIRHYGYKTSTETEFFWIHWFCDTNLLPGTNHITLENPYHINLYCRQLIDAWIMNKPAEVMDCLTRLILLEISINAHQPNTSPIVEKVRAWIRANNNSPITTEDVAKQMGYNADYLNRVFKATFQKTVKQYIDEERILFIKSLMLNHDIPLKVVARRSGFADYKYFLKFFKYHEGITPTEFAKQFSKLHFNSR